MLIQVDADRLELLLNCMAQFNFDSASNCTPEEIKIIKDIYYEARCWLTSKDNLSNQKFLDQKPKDNLSNLEWERDGQVVTLNEYFTVCPDVAFAPFCFIVMIS